MTTLVNNPSVVRRTTPYLVGLVAGSILAAIGDAVAYARNFDYGQLHATWPTVFILLLALWLVEDAKARANIHKPLDLGLFVFMFTIPYVPYYLWRTRRMKGMALLAGFVILYFLGSLAQLAEYAVR